MSLVNVMVVGLLAVAAYFVVVAIWMKRQGRDDGGRREGDQT